MDLPGLVEEGSYPTFGDAYNTFILGGGALGYGAASLVAGAYTGIATTPALIAHSFARLGFARRIDNAGPGFFPGPALFL